MKDDKEKRVSVFCHLTSVSNYPARDWSFETILKPGNRMGRVVKRHLLAGIQIFLLDLLSG
jgi:hypothetical protein